MRDIQVDALERMLLALPVEAMSVRQRFWSDGRFRAVCQEYSEAVAAAERFGAEPSDHLGRAQEFRELAEELLTEAARMLRARTEGGSSG